METEFGAGAVCYRETIENAVEGIGHFEPLRHYAEVHLLLEPLEPGSGLVFATDCREDELDKNWQRLILTHLEEKEHVGVLTGSAITDMKITLIAGRAHLKHTEGGDFRQATYRAVRQGLMQRLFGYATLQMEVIGYHEGGDDENNAGTAVGMLLPLCHIREVESILSSLLPAYVPVKKQISAKKYFPFISWSALFTFAIFALTALLTFSLMHLFGAPGVALAIVRLLMLLALLIILAVDAVGAFLSYKNAGLAKYGKPE